MKKDKNNQNREAFFDEQDDQASEALIDQLMATEFATPPPGILVPEAVWKEKKRQELREQLSTKPFRNRFSHGMEVIAKQLRDHLSKSDLEKINQELSAGAEHVVTLMSDPTEAFPVNENGSFQELMKISDETIEQLYQCGVRLTKAQHFKDAADVFFVLSILDHRRHNIWMALGLNEQHLGHMEPALKAYAMAMMTDRDDPWSYLHSAECYQSMDQKDDAKECLTACMAHIDHLPKDQADQVKVAAEHCRKVLLTR